MTKTLALIALTLLTATSAFAKSSTATLQERQLLCNALELSMEYYATDFALDKELCLKSSPVISESTMEDQRIVIGVVTFNYPPPRPSATLRCYTEYKGQPVLGSIIGGIETGVICLE
jgi:hypothetical protein